MSHLSRKYRLEPNTTIHDDEMHRANQLREEVNYSDKSINIKSKPITVARQLMKDN